MLGATLFRSLSTNPAYEVFGTCREAGQRGMAVFRGSEERLIQGVFADDFGSVKKPLCQLKPDAVINCIGLIKQLPIAREPIPAIQINALFPHQLSAACMRQNARFIHISTDCVFTGKKGRYTEEDDSDATDLYGRTKYLGEVAGDGACTLRTSIIGHELRNGKSLIEWFLSQNGRVSGYTNAIYSGLPTIELSEVIQKYVLPDQSLSGLFHVSSEPISKHDLLSLVAKQYRKTIIIEPSDCVREDKTLDSALFRARTGYHPPEWSVLVRKMHEDYLSLEKI
jgi:dTDP-4-dehydrorhamnose reductase